MRMAAKCDSLQRDDILQGLYLSCLSAEPVTDSAGTHRPSCEDLVMAGQCPKGPEHEWRQREWWLGLNGGK
jgi:hypothetical protein